MASIAERRLRPLWDAIDSRQYKSALKLATALQSKHPESPYALALKALVLERLGKSDEALQLCRQAKDMVPVDDHTLNTLLIVYQRLDHLEEASLCYENACAKCPGNMDLLMALFSSYVKRYNFVKQQQTAMKMYKAVGDDKYLFWAVCSIYLQVSPSNPTSLKLMTLAEALIKKRIDSDGITDLEALRMYIALLQQQGKHEAALEALSGKLGTLFTTKLELLRLQGDLLLRMHQYDRAALIFKEILQVISSDDWAAVKDLIKASLEICDGDGESSQRISDQEMCTRLDEVAQVMRDLQAVQHQEFVRAPWLALAEIESRRPGCDNMVLAASLLEYFKRFGHLSSFFSDIRCYIDLLDGPSKAWLDDRLREAFVELSSGPSDQLKVLRRQISIYQVAENTGAEKSLLETARLFKGSLPLSKDLDPQDSIIGEELLVITANLLIKSYIRSKSFGFLVEAIAVLEFGLSLREFNFRYKVMLVSLYSTIYAVTTAMSWYKNLDIKSILLEVATHHILPEILASPHWPELESVLTDSIKFSENYPHEAAEMSIIGYKHSNYTKVLEFVELKDKIQNSHQYLLVRVEFALLSLKKASEKLEEAQGIIENLDHGKKLLEWSSVEKISNLYFNEDLDVRPWWSPGPGENLLTSESGMAVDVDEAAKRQDRWRAHIKRRCLIPRLLVLAFTLSPGKEGWDGWSDFMQLFNSYVEGFGLTWESAASFLSEYISSPRCSLMDVSTAVTISLFWLVPQMSKSVDETLISLALVEDVLEAALKEMTGALTSATGPTEAIRTGTILSALFALTSETLGWFSLCLQAWTKRLQPVVKKKKKALEGSGTDQRLVDGLRSLVATICRQLEIVSLLLTERAHSSQEAEVEELMSLLCSSAADDHTPGQVLNILGAPDDRLPDKWDAGDILRKIVGNQRCYLTGVRDMCMSRLRFFKSLKF